MHQNIMYTRIYVSNKAKYSYVCGKILDICKLWGENRVNMPHTLQTAY